MIKFIEPMECESVEDCLRRRIDILSNVHVQHNGHLKVLEECADNDNNSPTFSKEEAITY